MELDACFPFWKQLTPRQQKTLADSVDVWEVRKGHILHNGSEDCVGLLLVLEGQLRAYILSDEGREITLYRLLQWDLCLLSASCIMNSIQFDITISAQWDSKLLHIPSQVYQDLMRESAAVANYTGDVMATRFSDVMWLLDQILYKKLDSRLAALLLEESRLNGAQELKITHEEAARHLGSAREVVTRMLKYMHTEGLIQLARGRVCLTDPEGLERMAADSLR